MSKHLPANREYELGLFQQVITGRDARRILLLEAESGMGKTTLVREFMRRRPANIDCAPLDFKGGSAGLHQIFYRLCDCLGWEYFSNFTARVEGLSQVNIADNKIIGYAEIEVALHSPDEGDRAARRAALTRAFFDDLRALKRALLLVFDTFEQAPPEAQGWLQSSFLAYARRTPHLTVIVAGRQIPDESIEWDDCCVSHRLTPIEDPGHWQNYCQAIGLALHSEAVRTCCILYKGRPNEVVQALVAVAGQGGSP